MGLQLGPEEILILNAKTVNWDSSVIKYEYIRMPVEIAIYSSLNQI
jgi:hypothetical protein